MSDVNVNEAVEAATPSRDTENGVTRPKAGTKTGRVWEIADEKASASGGRARRKDVLAQCEAEELNAATAATQYGRWRKYNGLEGRDEVDTPDVETEQAAEAPTAVVYQDDAGIEAE